MPRSKCQALKCRRPCFASNQVAAWMAPSNNILIDSKLCCLINASHILKFFFFLKCGISAISVLRVKQTKTVTL